MRSKSISYIICLYAGIRNGPKEKECEGVAAARFMMLFNIRFMWIYALQVHAERQHINFMAIEAPRLPKKRNSNNNKPWPQPSNPHS